jgi:hypothetical protein
MQPHVGPLTRTRQQIETFSTQRATSRRIGRTLPATHGAAIEIVDCARAQLDFRAERRGIVDDTSVRKGFFGGDRP